MMNAFDNMPGVLPQADAFSKAWENPVERLLVVHRFGSIVLFSHHFDKEGYADDDEDNIHGAAIDAMDKLLGEILSNDGHIRQIVYEDKLLSFAYGQHCSFITISNLRASGVLARLSRLAEAFELRFAAKLGKNFNIDMNEYQDARPLVDENFT